MKEVTMFEKEAEEWVKENMDCCKTDNSVNQSIPYFDEEERCCAKSAFQDGAESTLRKIIKYFSTIVLDEYCGGYFSYLLENEEKMQELAKELENV